MKAAGGFGSSLHVVEPSQRSGKPCANCVDPSRLLFFGQVGHADPLYHVYHPYTHSPQPHLPWIPHQHCRHPRTLTVSQKTHMQHKQQYMHHSHRNNRTHNNLTDRPRTTNTTQAHIPSSKSEINLIILQSQHKRTQKQTRGAQTVYSRHTCIYHHNKHTYTN